MATLIDLSGFRKRNSLSQAELGKAIGTSAAFISQVETETSKMPVEKIKTILAIAPEKGWCTDDLVPASARLDFLYEFVKSYYENNNDYVNPIDIAVPADLRESIRLGQTGIDSGLADRILAAWPREPYPSKQWLMNEEGDFLPPIEYDDFRNTTDIGITEIKELLNTLLTKQETIEKEILEIRAFLMHKK